MTAITLGGKGADTLFVAASDKIYSPQDPAEGGVHTQQGQVTARMEVK